MLKVFAADNSDIEWMCQLYMNAAENGHFLSLKSESGLLAIRRNIRSIIEKNLIEDFGLRAQAMVFEADTDKVGYVVMSEIKAGIGGNEIQLFVVDEKLRGKGYGALMLDEVIRRWHHASDIYARCFPASVTMVRLLRKANFRGEGKNDEGADVYRLPKLRFQQP